MLDSARISDINSKIRHRLKSQQSSPQKNFIINNASHIQDLKSHATSRVADYIKNFQTPFGNDIMGGLNSRKPLQQIDSLEEFTSAAGIKKNNHLQNAWRKTVETNTQTGKQTQKEKQLTAKLQQNNEKTYGVKAQFTRMHNQLRKRVIYQQHDQNNGQDSFKEIEIPKEFTEQLERAKPKDKLQYLMNLSSDLFINMKNTKKWMRNHQIDLQKYTQNKRNIQFAKDLFKIWDEDSSGNLEVDELTLPLIALGLSNDSSFVMKLLRSIDEEKFIKNKEHSKITVRDFSKIFRKDFTSEKIIEVLKQTIKAQREAKKQTKKQHMDQMFLISKNQQNIEKNAPIQSQIAGQRKGIGEDGRTTAPTSGGLFSAQDQRRIGSGISYNQEYGLNNFSQRQTQFKEEITLSDQLAIVRQWWQEIDKGKGNLTQKLDDVAKLLVIKKIAAEMETARRVVIQSTKKSKQEIDWEDFNQIFCKGIFKEVLISLANKIKQYSSNSKANQTFKAGDSLGGKLNQYQRKLLLEQLGTGLITDAKQLQGDNDRPVLYSLSQFKKNNGVPDPHFNVTYDDFLKDPLGQKRKAEEERLKNQYASDDFVKAIQLNNLTQNDQEAGSSQNKQQIIVILANQGLNDIDSLIKEHFSYLNTKENDQTDQLMNSKYKTTSTIQKKSKLLNEDRSIVQKDWNRAKEEIVKIPEDYIKKNAEERLNDQTDLLRKFQKILDQGPQFINICLIMALQELSTLEAHDDRIWCLAWNPQGSLIASCSSDKLIKVWSYDSVTNKLTLKCQLSDGHKRTIRNMSWHPDGRMLASASFDGTAGVWFQEMENTEFEQIAQLEGHENEVKSVAWNHDGQFLATCSRDKTIWIWEKNDENEFECAAVLSGHSQDVKFVKWHPEKNLLFSTSYDDSIKCWKYEDSIDDWMCAYTMEGHESTVWQIDFDASGDYMVSCGEDKNWMIWKINEKTFENKGMISNLHQRSIYSCSWAKTTISSPADVKTDFIATAGADNKIMVYEINRDSLSSSGTGSFEFNIVAQQAHAHSNDVNSVVFHPTNPYILASCSDDGKIKLWKVNLENGTQPNSNNLADQQMEEAPVQGSTD
eukprot:403339480